MTHQRSCCEDSQKSLLYINGHTGNNIKIKHTSEDEDHDDNVDDDIYCGVGLCRPKFAEKYRTMAYFTAAYSLTGIVTSALNMYINSQITTLEKHFNFSSSVSGFLMSSNDLGYLSTTLFMSYYTRRVHVPRALAISTLMYGISGLLCTLAFVGSINEIATPPKENYDNDAVTAISFTQMCSNFSSLVNASCHDISDKANRYFHISETWRTTAICIIGIGMILQGMAKSPRQPFLGTFVDDNVPKTKTTLYLGIITGLSIFGPAIAFGLGGVFSSIYVTLEETSITPRDPRWLGAWWLGFLVFGGAGLVAGIPLVFFPRRFRRQRELEVIRHRQQTSTKQRSSSGNLKLCWEFREFLKSIIRLCLNPVYMCLVLATGVNVMGISGMMSFMPKYMEAQFAITASQANIILGGINILSASVGTVLGGYFTSRLKLSPVTCLKLMLSSMLISTAVMCFGFFLGCEQPVIYTGNQANSSGGEILSKCVQNCNCDDENFFPICGADGKNYFSPCHAGCFSTNQMTFMNCSCLLASNKSQTAESGLCVLDCSSLYPYIALAFVGAFTTTLVIMPGFVVTVRSVKEEDKPLAIGFSAFAGTLIGWFPGPVIFGTLIDTTCILWRTTCGSSGACSLYNIELLRVRLHTLLVVLRSITLSLYIVALILAACSKRTIFQSHIECVPVVAEMNFQDIRSSFNGAEVALIIKMNPHIRETEIK